jgi:hypothetical protein
MRADQPDDRYDLDSPVVVDFDLSASESVAVSVHRVDVTAELALVRGTVATSTLGVVEQLGAFHLDEPTGGVGFEAGIPVEITMKLDDTVFARIDTGDALVGTLFGEAPTDLRNAASWYVVELMQNVPLPDMEGAEASFGMQTRWAAS